MMEAPALVVPQSFAFHVTYTCPLACAHCCFSSSPKNRDALSITTILETIDQLNSDQIRLVAFTGGEPFLLGDRLVQAIRRCHERGFSTRVVTSAFFGGNEEDTENRIRAVREAGLDELSISWDDFHEEFVSFNCVRNVFFAAKRHSVRPGVSIVQAATSRWTAQRVRAELGLAESSDEVICEVPLNRTGRAGKQLLGAGLRPERVVSPCPYILTGPALNAKNRLLACCGVIPETNDLVLDSDFKPANLHETMEKALRSPLLNWLHLRGPYAIMQWISQRFGVPIPSKHQIGGNCEACRWLFGTPEIARHIPDALLEKATEIESEVQVLETLGLLSPRGILDLWRDGLTVVDNAPSPHRAIDTGSDEALADQEPALSIQ